MNYLKQLLGKPFIVAGLVSVSFLLVQGCGKTAVEVELKDRTLRYFELWNTHNFRHPEFASFMQDSVLIWHNKKTGTGTLSVFDPDSGWKQWDRAWNGRYEYEILDIDIDSLKVIGLFRETNDFLKHIGMPEGYSATVTYWFSNELKVGEILYDWSEHNQDMHVLVRPIVEWAKKNDANRIHHIYLKDGFIPNGETSGDWKILLDSYLKMQDSL